MSYHQIHQHLGADSSVIVTTPPDWKTRLKNFWKNLHLKSACQHIGLLVILTVYTVAGGMVFRRLEYPAELEKINVYNVTLSTSRRLLIQSILDKENFTTFERELQNYEEILRRAFEAGVSIRPEEQIAKWTILRAVFFSSTVLTTIGYGNITPETTEGRIFCIVFALVGIPLTLTVIADWGKLFAHAASSFVKHIPPLPYGLRCAFLVQRTTSYAFLSVCFLFLYLAIGAAAFVEWEEDWTFFEGFYFCFITMTTIGFGDLVPKQPTYMLLCTLYILIGLALTSTIIELVRTQYAQSWKQLRALQGPLADQFRKIADNATGLDVLSFQQDFMKVITAVSVPKKLTSVGSTKRDKKVKVTDWEDAMEAAIRDMIVKSSNSQNFPPVVQFIIYETSVYLDFYRTLLPIIYFNILINFSRVIAFTNRWLYHFFINTYQRFSSLK
ncbi:TWiK family of potassium channels protein 9-like [Harmonia axyridis]|uniref:TWiK family of potassium channels protein 9-like n=1 Tax=Harmonia axyridis TaxID=115357 RepID=UPI001E277CF8|nr:TWiK family of potassium channels protein 9-like [Harmonia axyridis]